MSVSDCNITNGSKFDWYQATVPYHPDFVLAEAVKLYPSGTLEHGRGKLNYRHTTTVQLPNGDRPLSIYHGGSNGSPNVQASSAYAPPVASMLRTSFPGHEVTRVDVCTDMMSPGLWDVLHPICQDVTRRHKMKGRIQLPDDLDEGRTYYMGSPTSQAYARLYEKGKEQLKKTGDPAFRSMMDWVRVEMQVRPQRENRGLFSHVTPEQAWGFTSWSIDLSKSAFNLDAAKFGFSLYRKSADENARRHLAAQYFRLFSRWAESTGGSWEKVGSQLKELIDEVKTGK